MSSAVPWHKRRLVALPVIIALNVVVFLGWQAARMLPQLQPFFIANFLVSPLHLAHGYVWTLLTSEFSHNALWHIAINMVVLFSFGAVLERLWGAWRFTIFYLAAAIIASLSHCLTTVLVIGRTDIPALGASGAVAGLLMAFALLFPKERILVLGVLPIPALIGALAFVGLDVWGLIAQGRGGGLPIGHGAHLGGAAFGAAAYFFYFKPRLRRRRPLTGGAHPPPLVLTPDEATELERLRTKLADSGPESLSDSERAFLGELHRRMQERAARDEPR